MKGFLLFLIVIAIAVAAASCSGARGGCYATRHMSGYGH